METTVPHKICSRMPFEGFSYYCYNIYIPKFFLIPMKKRLKFLGVTFMALLMILLAFSGVAHNATSHNNGRAVDNLSGIMPFNSANQNVAINGRIAFLNEQEIHDLQKFMIYNLVHYGTHHRILDQLKYKADLNFISWYTHNYELIPPSSRGIGQQNASVILSLWEKGSPEAKTDLQAVADYKLKQISQDNQIDVLQVEKNRLGVLISNQTIVHKSQTIYKLTYRYSENNQTLIYALISNNGEYTPIDPYFWLNDFTVHWGWGGLISGTSYNIYMNFTNLYNANAYKNFIVNALTLDALITDLISGVVWGALGGIIGIEGYTFAALLAGIVSNVVSDVTGVVSLLELAKNVNTLFSNEWDSTHSFYVAFTLNNWEWGLVPEFSVWGLNYPEKSLFPVFKQVEPITGGDAAQNFITLFNQVKDVYGTNTEHYLPDPPQWADVALYFEG